MVSINAVFQYAISDEKQLRKELHDHGFPAAQSTGCEFLPVACCCMAGKPQQAKKEKKNAQSGDVTFLFENICLCLPSFPASCWLLGGKNHWLLVERAWYYDDSPTVSSEKNTSAKAALTVWRLLPVLRTPLKRTEAPSFLIIFIKQS